MKTFIKKILFNEVFCFIFSWFSYVFHLRINSKQSTNDTTTLKSYYYPQKSSCINDNKIINYHKYNLQIIIPCFNSDKFLKECIDSILNKAINYSISIILVDDGSTDNTSSICDEYATTDPRVIVIHQQNKGFSAARNSGLNLINSDFLMFIDSDDYLKTNFDLNDILDKAYQLNKKDITIVEFGFIRKRQNKFFGRCVPKNGYMHPFNYKGFAWGKIFPSEIFTSVRFPLNYWFEDTFIKMIVLFLKGIKCFGVPIVGYVYRDNQGSITHNYCKSKKSLDSFYIMSSLLEDAKKLHITFDRQYSTIVMSQIVCTFSRTRRLKSNITDSVFLQTQKLISAFEIKPPSSMKYYFLYKSIVNNQIKSYKNICTYLAKSK